ncbi:MAG: hypothetical protein WAK26_17595 [Terracidiphilus sp.]
MTKARWARYTPGFKREAVRLEEPGKTMAAAGSLEVAEQTMGSRIKLH